MEVYKDLWRSDEDRDNRQEFELANENVRKLVSKDDSGNKATKTDGVLDLTIANMCDRMKIPLGKILGEHGPYAQFKKIPPAVQEDPQGSGRRGQGRIQTYGPPSGVRDHRERGPRERG